MQNSSRCQDPQTGSSRCWHVLRDHLVNLNEGFSDKEYFMGNKMANNNANKNLILDFLGTGGILNITFC